MTTFCATAWAPCDDLKHSCPRCALKRVQWVLEDIARVQAFERRVIERCAAVCEATGDAAGHDSRHEGAAIAYDCADAIRREP